MDTQLQQLRDAVKAVAKARAEGRPVDLSSLPPEIRNKIQAQLDKLPPDARAQLEGKVAGVAHKVANRQGSPIGTPVMPKYHGHFNNTVRPGDATRIPLSWIAVVLLVTWGFWKVSGA